MGYTGHCFQQSAEKVIAGEKGAVHKAHVLVVKLAKSIKRANIYNYTHNRGICTNDDIYSPLRSTLKRHIALHDHVAQPDDAGHHEVLLPASYKR